MSSERLSAAVQCTPHVAAQLTGWLLADRQAGQGGGGAGEMVGW